MSSRTILSAHYTGILPLTRAPNHTNGVHRTQFTTLTKIINRGLNNRGKHGASIVLEKKKCFGVGFEGVQRQRVSFGQEDYDLNELLGIKHQGSDDQSQSSKLPPIINSPAFTH